MLHILHNHPPLYSSQPCVHVEMRDFMERLIVLPFSGVGCVSQSSVAVADHSNKGSKPEISSSSTNTQDDEGGVKSVSGSMKSSLRFLALSKSNNISTGFQKLFKSFSQLFVYKEETDDEEEDREMEIGYPTDVKHVTHIGYDGSSSTNRIKRRDSLIPAEFLSSIPSISLLQFEHSMAAQARSPPYVA